jgi:hypothetical protein
VLHVQQNRVRDALKPHNVVVMMSDRALCLLAAVVLTVLTSGTAAAMSADPPFARAYADNGASWAEATPHHGAVCDNDRDGHSVTGYFRAGNRVYKAGDGNGSKPGCGQINAPSGTSFTAVKVCEESVGCSRYVKLR